MQYLSVLILMICVYVLYNSESKPRITDWFLEVLRPCLQKLKVDPDIEQAITFWWRFSKVFIWNNINFLRWDQESVFIKYYSDFMLSLMMVCSFCIVLTLEMICLLELQVEDSLFHFQRWLKTMETEIEQQEEETTFSNSDTNGNE